MANVTATLSSSHNIIRGLSQIEIDHSYRHSDTKAQPPPFNVTLLSQTHKHLAK